MTTRDCDTVTRYSKLAGEAVRTRITLLMELKERGPKKCGMTNWFDFIEIVYWLAAGKEVELIRLLDCCLWVRFVCGVVACVA